MIAGGSGPGLAGQNEWRGNQWSQYAGFDEDGDGVGDTPFEHLRLGAELLARHPALKLFSGSLALSLLDLLGRFLPLLQPEPVVVDPAPRRSVPAVERWKARLSTTGTTDRRPTWPAAGWALAGALGVGLALRGAGSLSR